jgi:hypothetical protein
MSDIYEQKARKYKYKYLKLKQEYFGEGGGILEGGNLNDKCIEVLPLSLN